MVKRSMAGAWAMIAACCAGLSGNAAAQSPLETIYAGGNGLGANSNVYFDINVSVPIQITSLEVNLSSAIGTGCTINWYMTVAGSTFYNNTAVPGAWMQMGTGTGTSAGGGAHTAITLAAPITIQPGTYGVAVNYQGSGMNYTNGTPNTAGPPGSATNSTYTRTEITLLGGASGAGTFTGGTNNPRIWNGTIHYTVLGGPAACCMNDGSCQVLSGTACTGLYQVNTTACNASAPFCPNTASACCNHTTGACSYVNGTTCPAGSTNGGANSVCSPSPCAPIGSCCTNTTGACAVIFGGSCNATTQTANASTTCAPGTPSATCAPTGSCCTNATGACAVIFGGSCTATQTANASLTCDPAVPSATCPATGACCSDTTGACSVIFGGSCPTGTSSITGTTCGPGTPSTSCPFGACCQGCAGCSIVSGSACPPADFRGNGSSCAVACPNDGYRIEPPPASVVFIPGTVDTGLHADDGTLALALPFPVSFYNTQYNAVTMSTNGNLQFGTNITSYINNCLPSTTINGPTIFAFWDDLYTTDTAGGQGIFTTLSGVTPNQTLAIEWRTTYCCAAGAPLNSFEVIFYEGQPHFDVLYGTPMGDRASATIGVQKSGAVGSPFLQHICNVAGPTSGTALRFICGQTVTGNGACCANDGSCQVTLNTACSSPSLFQTIGSTCNASAPFCPTTASACCNTSTGACAYVNGTTCAAGFSNSGANSVCSPNSCPPGGSCCSYGGSCTPATQPTCTGNSLFTVGGSCTPNPCGTVGACCVGATCFSYTANGCTAVSGAFTSPGSCSPGYPAPTLLTYMTSGITEDISIASANPGTPGVFATLDDNFQAGVPIGFNFSYYGTTYTTANIATNGVMNFGAGASGYPPAYTAFPSATVTPLGAVAPYWVDLILTSANQITYATRGTSPNRRFIVQWNNIGRYQAGVPTGTHTFQAILHETSNAITFRYGTLTTGTPTVATIPVIGIEETSGSAATASTIDGNMVFPGDKAVVFCPVSTACTGTPVTGACCIGPACTSVTVCSCLTSDGAYQGDTTLCTPNPCGGSCCDGANCSLALNQGACTGTFNNGGSCNPNPCATAQPGACCSGATCVVVADLAACSARNPASTPVGANTRFVGAGTACNAAGNIFTPCCRGDFNQNGFKTVQDLFDFLAAWFSKTSQADTNGNPPCFGPPCQTAVSVQDLFDYLAAWFTGCGP